MRNLLRRLLPMLLFLGFAVAGIGQTAEVTRNVNLRSDPSTDNPPIRLLTTPERLNLLEPDKTNGYFHVQTSLGEKGWVWSRNVRVLETAATPTPAPEATETPTQGPGITAAVTPTPPPSGPASEIDPTWEKGTPTEITFVIKGGTCGPDGDKSKDPETNLLKNRVDEPSSAHEVRYEAILNLPKPHVHTTRKAWTAADRATAATQIVPYEGIALTVSGYIVNQVKLENGGEGTNCNSTLEDEVDWHIPLVAHSHDPEKLAVVVETTPRVRKNHPKWMLDKLGPWVNADASIRVTGWLLFDPDHPNMMYDPANPNKPKKYRQTLWEIHPITKIEVWKDGGWVDLESLP